LEGVKTALTAEPELQVVLVGPAEIVDPVEKAYPARVKAVPATEFIAMDEHPAEAVRSKKDSTIVVGCKLVADGQADGFFSAGSTGAVMAAATLIMGRIRGISRPMIATLFPAVSDAADSDTEAAPRYVVFGDVGANADVKPEYLLQFAHMGEAYARAVLGINDPRVGLLNIGEEDTKGNELAQQTHQLLRAELDSFAGNAEGTDILAGSFDVIVTDGFTGNVVLKTIEGAAGLLFTELRATLALVDRSVAAAMTPRLNALKMKLSADDAGGAPLLGVRGSCFIGHGSSSPIAIANGILATAKAAQLDLPTVIAEAVSS
jgi:glycerol-3-phosphate acyltransferase PlsX